MSGEQTKHIAFGDDWGQLFRMAEEYAKAQGELSPEDLAQGRARAARELAQNALDVYNDWLGGECYGIVCETFDLHNPQAEPEDYEWEHINDDACWGFVGSDFAIESLHEQFFDQTVADLRVEALV